MFRFPSAQAHFSLLPNPKNREQSPWNKTKDEKLRSPKSLLSDGLCPCLFGRAWSRPIKACHLAQQGGNRRLRCPLGSLLPLNTGLCASPLITRYLRQPAEKNSDTLELPAGKPWSPVVGNSSQPASQAGIFRFCLEDTETFIHFSSFVWSHCNPRHVIEMGYNCGLLHPPIWVSRKELPAVPFLARESQNGFFKIIICWSRRGKKKTYWGEGALGLDWYGEEGYLLFWNLVLVLSCKL